MESAEPCKRTRTTVGSTRRASNQRQRAHSDQSVTQAVEQDTATTSERGSFDGSQSNDAKKPRGRRRMLPAMTNSERAKYYRHRHAIEREQLELATTELQEEVRQLELRLDLHRQLEQTTVQVVVKQRVLQQLEHFTEHGLARLAEGLRDHRHIMHPVLVVGGGDGLVARVRCVVRGRLSTPVIHSIYPVVLGDTVLLDEMMHREIEYECSYFLWFASDGSIQRQEAELGTIMGLRQPLRNLKTIAKVLMDVDVHPAAHDRVDE